MRLVPLPSRLVHPGVFEKAAQRGRSERGGEAYQGPVAGAPIAILTMGRDATGESYVEPLTGTRCLSTCNGFHVQWVDENRAGELFQCPSRGIA